MKAILSSKVDLSSSRLKPYQGFIFLCGGPTDATSHRPVSIRDAIYRELVKHPGFDERIRVAEEFKNWAADAIYRDLITFERHLAELSSVIVLALESAGSIAELGLFSAVDEFKKKLLVFVETDHYNSNSFIRLGPIDYLERQHGNAAQCHRWKSANNKAPFDPEAAESLKQELAEPIKSRASEHIPERPFDKNGWLDVALLVCDLLGLYSALTIRELREQLGLLGCERSESELRQLLYLLSLVRLVAMEPRGDQRFFVTLDDRQHVGFSLIDRTFDPMRFRSDLLRHYEKEERKRFRAIQEVRSRHA